jgi:hypothetical protein
MFSKHNLLFSLLSLIATLGIVWGSIGTAKVSANQGATSAAANASLASPSKGCNSIQFDPNNFSNPTKIDNKWLPLTPGTKFVLQGRSNRGNGMLPHRVVFIVTDLTKVIDGVRTVVLYDRDFNEDQLSEAELTFFAQDNDGNIWNLGEYPEEYKNKQFHGAPSTWIAGIEQAEAGVQMLGRPKIGTPSYRQGLAPSVGFLDCAKVFQRGEKSCVPAGCYNNVLVTDEWSPLDPSSGHQRKFNAPGVGVVQVAAVNDPEGETLVLTMNSPLSPDRIAIIRQKALRLDQHGYIVSPDVYGQTPPAE